MPLLFDEDYKILKKTGLEIEEDEELRFLVLRDYPLRDGLYTVGGQPRSTVDILYIIPPNYNTQGGDMFWLNPQLARSDGKAIPAISASGQDSRTYKGTEFLRWSRHWNKNTWKPKVDNIQTILNRLEWALSRPDADKA